MWVFFSWTLNSKSSHSVLLSETVDNLHGMELWGRKRGTGWSEEKRRLHMQKSVGGSSLLSHYGMNHTPVHTTWGWVPWYNHINTDNPVTLNIPRENRKQNKQTNNKTKTEEKKDGARGRSQNTRELLVQILSFTDGYTVLITVNL